MGVLLILFAIFVPRFVMVIILLFTNWFSQGFQTIIWPVLGFILMPYTTLAYMAAVIYNNQQIAGGWLVLLIAAVIIDLGGQGGSISRHR